MYNPTITALHEEGIRLVAEHTDQHGTLPQDAGLALDALLECENEDIARETLGDLRAALGLPSGDLDCLETT